MLNVSQRSNASRCIVHLAMHSRRFALHHAGATGPSRAALALDAIEGRVPLDRLVHVGDGAHDERVEATPDVAFPARHGRDVGPHGCVAVRLRDLRVAAGEESRLRSDPLGGGLLCDFRRLLRRLASHCVHSRTAVMASTRRSSIRRRAGWPIAPKTSGSRLGVSTMLSIYVSKHLRASSPKWALSSWTRGSIKYPRMTHR